MSENIEVQEVAYHRNGVAGEGFWIVAFKHETDDMVGVVFFQSLTTENEDEYLLDDNPRVAVFNRKLLGEGVIAFGHNSFRGDNFAEPLREAIIANKHI